MCATVDFVFVNYNFLVVVVVAFVDGPNNLPLAKLLCSNFERKKKRKFRPVDGVRVLGVMLCVFYSHACQKKSKKYPLIVVIAITHYIMHEPI